MFDKMSCIPRLVDGRETVEVQLRVSRHGQNGRGRDSVPFLGKDNSIVLDG